MGWCSGSELMGKAIQSIQTHVSHNPAIRRAIYRDLIPAFEDQDCDTLDECRGKDPSYDAALDAAHPEHFKDLSEHD